MYYFQSVSHVVFTPMYGHYISSSTQAFGVLPSFVKEESVTLFIFSYCRFKSNISDSQEWILWAQTHSRLLKLLWLDGTLASTITNTKGIFLSSPLLTTRLSEGQKTWEFNPVVYPEYEKYLLFEEWTCILMIQRRDFQLSCAVASNWKKKYSL